VSAPESGIRLASCAADMVEIAALHGARPSSRTSRAPGASSCRCWDGWGGRQINSRFASAGALALLVPPAHSGATAALWQAACARVGAAIDLSSGLAAWHLAGAQVRDVLARACRLDLDPQVFPPGSAAATVMAQVAVILAVAALGACCCSRPRAPRGTCANGLPPRRSPSGSVSGADVTVAVLSGDESP